MKSILPISIVICLLGYSLQGYTHTQLLEAINFARTNPKEFAETAFIGKSFWNAKKQAWGDTPGEPGCFQKAYDWLKNEAPVLPPFIESPVAVLAAYKHTKWMATSVPNKFGHRGENGSWPIDRVFQLGTFDSKGWGFNENLAGAKPGISPNSWVFQWITDCGVNPRGHRDNIFSTKVTHYGCAEYASATRWTYITCVGVSAMTFLPEIKAQTDLLAEAGL